MADLRADAVAFWLDSGSWLVAKAKTSNDGFGPATTWITGHGVGSDHRFLARVDTGLTADAVIFINGDGSWHVAKSNGSTFNTPSPWLYGHGAGSDNQILSDGSGDSRADAIGYWGDTGSWIVATAKPTDNGFNPPGPAWIAGHGIGS